MFASTQMLRQHLPWGHTAERPFSSRYRPRDERATSLKCLFLPIERRSSFFHLLKLIYCAAQSSLSGEKLREISFFVVILLLKTIFFARSRPLAAWKRHLADHVVVRQGDNVLCVLFLARRDLPCLWYEILSTGSISSLLGKDYLICIFSFLFSLQEVGSIIGKKGEIVKRFREEVNIFLVFRWGYLELVYYEGSFVFGSHLLCL